MFALIAVRSGSETLFGSSSIFGKTDQNNNSSLHTLEYVIYKCMYSLSHTVKLIYVNGLFGETHNTPVSFDVVLEGDGSTDPDHVVLGLLKQSEQ